VVVDDAGLLLMTRHGSSGALALPEGRHLPGEPLAATVSRVVAVETGVDVELNGLVGVYADPDLSITVRARPVSGDLRSPCGCTEPVWVEPEQLDDDILPTPVRLRIEHATAREPVPYLA
jgi:ADP-ribose pyrophosphatase YjhB (NUDIX family)